MSMEAVASSREQQKEAEREIHEVAQEIEEGRVEVPIGEPEPRMT